MDDKFKACLWKNFAATIDMFSNVVELCPDFLWDKKDRFFFMSYHTAIFLDYYLSHPVKSFDPTLAYTNIEQSEQPQEALDDVMPNRHYTKKELLSYIGEARIKCAGLIGPDAHQDLFVKWIEKSEIELHGLCPSIVEEYTIIEIIFYNFRHVQHHVGQLNFILRSNVDMAVDWVAEGE